MEKTLIRNIGQLVTPEGTKARHGGDMDNLRIVEHAAVLAEDGTIVYAGPEEALTSCGGAEVIDAGGACAVPGFVDSHTHFIFGGYREKEFMLRLQGTGYMEIMKMGGGIRNTVNATRKLSTDEMATLGNVRLESMLSQGVTTIEGKSGYGLDLETELRQLQAMRTLDKIQPVEISSTYLGAHAVPDEFKGDAEAYIDFMIGKALPRIKAEVLAESCDVFCEDGVFSQVQSERILRAAKDMGFKVKLHADEIVSLGGGELAARLGAVSADHLLMISERGISELASSDTVATLLPLTAFCLGHPFAPARKMIDRGCAVALASDFNPGSCFADSIPLLLALAVIHMKMTLNEALTALTLNGAAAIGRASRVGSLEPGKQADIVLLKFPDYRFLVYHTCANIVKMVLKKGRVVL